MVETWTVTERKMVWNKLDRTYTRTERVVATGVSKARADALMMNGRHHDWTATPDPV